MKTLTSLNFVALHISNLFYSNTTYKIFCVRFCGNLNLIFIIVIYLAFLLYAKSSPIHDDKYSRFGYSARKFRASTLTKFNTTRNVSLTIDYYDSLPSSFAVLINFGLNGQSRYLYSSRLHNELCKSKDQIWDPFNNECRQLYCKDNFELKHLKCVGSNKINNSDDDPKPFLKFLDSQSEFVNITIDFKSNKTSVKEWIQNKKEKIIQQFSAQFSHNLNININRITNVTIKYTKDNCFNVNFLILDTGKRKNDDILRTLSQEVLQKRQHYEILDRTIQAVSFHSMVAEIQNFCLKETDMPIWYWNSDFSIFTKNNLTYLQVNKTGRIYDPGQYIGSVLYIQSVDNQNKINVSSNAVVCEQTLIDENCPRILLNKTEYEFRNGKYLYSNGIYFPKYELTDNQSVFVCLRPPKRFDWNGSLDVKIESILSTGLMLLSITLLTIVLITFVRLKSIRNTINGFNMINLVACLAVMQITFLTNQFIQQCRVSAVMFHYFILTTISWSSVIAFDMHRVFTKDKLISRSNGTKIRLLYGLAAYILPLMIVAIANLGDILNIENIKGDYGSVFPSSVCWMRRRKATIVYFIVPSALTVFFNFILYIHIIFNIRNQFKSFSSLRKVTRMASGSSQNSTISIISSSDSSTSKISFNQTSIYTRLSVPLGFTWIIALFSTIVPEHYTIIIRIMSYLFIIANTSQGVVLFLAFGVYKKMFAYK